MCVDTHKHFETLMWSVHGHMVQRCECPNTISMWEISRRPNKCNNNTWKKKKKIVL